MKLNSTDVFMIAWLILCISMTVSFYVDADCITAILWGCITGLHLFTTVTWFKLK